MLQALQSIISLKQITLWTDNLDKALVLLATATAANGKILSNLFTTQKMTRYYRQPNI